MRFIDETSMKNLQNKERVNFSNEKQEQRRFRKCFSRAIAEHCRLEHKCINDQQVSPEHTYRERARAEYAPCARGVGGGVL